MSKSTILTLCLNFYKPCRTLFSLTAAGLFCLTAYPVIAETPLPPPAETAVESGISGRIYVSDNLKTALRSGPTTNHRIIDFLEAGTPLEVISGSEEWIEVKVVNDDKTGWVNRISIQKNRGAKALLAQREIRINELNTEITDLHTQLNELKSTQSDTESGLDSVTDQFNRLNKEYEELQKISKSAVQNHNRMQELQDELAQVKTEYTELEIANSILKQDNYNKGLVHGLIAVIFGVIITLIVPRLKTRRNSNRW